MTAEKSAKQDLSLPQNCSKKQLDARRQEVDDGRKQYEFDHSWTGYPPSILRVPWKETPPEGVVKLVESGFNLEKSELEQWARHVADKLAHIGRKEGPFDAYTALYARDKLPPIAEHDRWQHDAVFGAQRLAGMYPWFIERVANLPAFRKDFPITDEMLAGVLPKNETLASLQAKGRLYFVSHPALEGAKPAHDHVMTAPTTLYCVSDLGQLMPIAIQLVPKTSPANPVFTPNADPNTWLAVKIHAACADTLVHSIYSHAILMHFVMCNVWTAANRTLPSGHPIHAFLAPHFWSTLFVTNAVKASMDKASGAQCSVYGTGLDGQNQMVSRLYRGFDFRRYDPHFDFAARGVDDADQLPEFWYRDDALRLWEADHRYVEEMMGLFYRNDGDVAMDMELQAWMAELASPEGAGIVGLPVGAQSRIETRKQLHHLLTSILFTVTSRHSSIENGALEYGYVPANPFAYRMEAPSTATKKLALRDVAKKLPPIRQAIKGYALIATADFDPEEFGLLGRYDADFTDGWPAGARVIIAKWNAALAQIGAEIDARNERLATPYTGMDPRRTYNSIWN